MTYNIGFYIHHHGSGHLMRALAIAAHLDKPVTFLGSGLQAHQHQIPPSIRCIHLPADVPDENDDAFDEGPAIDCLHYAPLNTQGIRRRNQLLTDFFAASYPMLLIVDVSVEIALFARLCGVPTMVVRQHGDRNDAAHLAAYQSASLLLAPYPETFKSGSFTWVDDKTYFSGGFSTYTGVKKPVPGTDNSYVVAVMTGKGGTSIDSGFVAHLAKTCPHYHFHVIGDLPAHEPPIVNVTFHGISAHPELILTLCSIVIGNAGHNTVMEVADLDNAFICIPEDRPFQEQLHKALLLKRHYGVPLVMPADLWTTDWEALLDERRLVQQDWYGMINPEAFGEITAAIDQLAGRLFNFA